MPSNPHSSHKLGTHTLSFLSRDGIRKSVRTLAPNFTSEERDGATIYYSYQTPVAIETADGRRVRRAKKFSATTTRQLNQFARGFEEVDEAEWAAAMSGDSDGGASGESEAASRKQIASNFSSTTKGGVTLFYSYDTPVAAILKDGRKVRRAKKFSATTSKQLSRYAPDFDEVDESEWASLVGGSAKAARPATLAKDARARARKAGYVGDEDSTRVTFKYEKDSKDEVYAVLWDYGTERNGSFTVYAHIGQHSSASPSYINSCRTAPESDPNVKALKSELEGIGYKLTVVQRKPSDPGGPTNNQRVGKAARPAMHKSSPKKPTRKIKARLEELRRILEDESISYGELAELQGLADYIDDDDVQLLEAAGVEEFSRNKAARPAMHKSSPKKPTRKIKARLEELRRILEDESISYGELAELQGLADYIDDDDVQLLEAAGVEEFSRNKAARPVVLKSLSELKRIAIVEPDPRIRAGYAEELVKRMTKADDDRE